MPLFGNKEKGKHVKRSNITNNSPNRPNQQSNVKIQGTNKIDTMNAATPVVQVPKTTPTSTTSNPSNLVFYCQEAQGSATCQISNFSNVAELYEKLASCFGFPVDEILFCTLNTHRIDMDNLLSSQLCLEDFIFVHRKGIKKEVEVTKTESSLGLTITDNGRGYSFIKRIRKSSTVDSISVIQVGDHIESIDGNNLVGKRHVEVANYLKNITIGTTFTIRLIEPLRSGFINIGNKSEGRNKPKVVGTGMETLRFKSNAPPQIQQAPTEYTKLGVSRVNNLLENFIGINDAELAMQIWEMAEGCENTMKLAELMDNSDLESFGFTDDFIIEVWGLVTDAKAGRLKLSPLEQNEGICTKMSKVVNIGREAF